MPNPAPPTAKECEVGLVISPGVELASRGAAADGVPIMVSLRPPEGGQRTPVDIVLVVDVSGSMGTEAIVKLESGDTAGHGLSVLDIVKHALRTIMGNLNEYDRVALVAYSNDAKTIFGLQEMTAAGRASSESKLDELQPTGMTNLWDGLKTGIEILKTGKVPGRLQHAMIFTDGLPNINPPRGIVPMLKRLKDKEGGQLCCSLNTFGFGYELDSDLLSQLAIEGCGAYAFIPDAGFVGTVFVNSTSNLLVSMAKDVTLRLKATNGASFAGPKALGGHPCIEKDGALQLSLGMLQFGQSKDVVVHMNVPSGAVSAGYLEVVLEYGTRGENFKVEAKGSGQGDPQLFPQVEEQRLRLLFVDAVRHTMKAGKLSAADKATGKALPLADMRQVAEDMQKVLRASPSANSENIEALMEDLTGQVSEAISREDWYQKWGIHFLPSLMFAHLTQQCNNFKDAGVQNYGGELFNTIRDAADDFFLTLPAPTPSARPPPAPAPAAARSSFLFGRMGGTPDPRTAPFPHAEPINMSMYHDRSAGCIDGSCSVEMADGSTRRVHEVRKGDALRAGSGTGTAEVLCVVRTVAASGRFLLVELPGGLRATPHHPVLVDGAWRFPVDLAPAEERPCIAVYTFVLHGDASSVVIGGVPCVSMGHGIQEGAARHPFFGSRQAVEDLSKLAGFEAGFVELSRSNVARDPETGLVCAFQRA
mmetsp:Transcript_79277/g.169881  ORF Transcript_79277/g.169881 Transcript_79277/m.169881 type:complete len:704 (-) Transcript_79277:28-2139(-)